nr:MAG TPA: hypothetical protein [Caudoviricetes sp.]
MGDVFHGRRRGDGGGNPTADRGSDGGFSELTEDSGIVGL